MRIGLLRFSWIAALAASWGITWASSAAPAQERLPTGAPVATSSSNPEEASHRTTEVQIELALLGDPVTFPYFLEARVEGGRVELRGFVPDQDVQGHALKLARLNSSLPVVDATRVQSNLAVNSTRLPPEKLYASVHTALAKSVPTSANFLRIECDSDGKVRVSGPIQNIEEKLAVSQCLRRLHGCAQVVNTTHLGDPSAAPRQGIVLASASAPAEGAPAPRNTQGFEESDEVVLVQNVEPGQAPPSAAPARQAPAPFGGFFNRLFGKKTNSDAIETPMLPSRDPVKVTNVGEPKSTGWGTPPRRPLIPGTPTGFRNPFARPSVPPTDGGAVRKPRALSAAQVRSRLEKAFPAARPIVVTPEGGNKLKVELSARTSEEGSDIAGRLLSLPEMQAYDVNLHIRVETPMNKQ